MVETPDFLMESVAPASSFDKTFTIMNARPSQQSTSSGSLPAEFVGMFDLKETLGSGHFSVVKKAQHVLSRRAVAVKIIDKKALKPDELKHLDHEVKAMRLVKHPHVIRLYEVKDTKTKLFLILELGDGGDLYEYLTKNGKLSEEHAQTIFRQIVEAVAYCHKHHIAHRDLKPENIVFVNEKSDDGTSSLVVKVTDFGLSNDFAPGEKMMTSCGSLSYTCPEVLLGDPYDGPKADVWSLGVLLYMMICGKLPFQGHCESATVTAIMDVAYEVPSYMSAECHALISRMLAKDPNDRICVGDILSCSWCRDLQPSDPSSPTVEYEDGLPKLSPEQQQHILHVMEDNGMNKDDILRSLRNNQFDSMASTYCLLAERELKSNGVRRRTNTANPNCGTSPRTSKAPQRSRTVSSKSGRLTGRSGNVPRAPSLADVLSNDRYEHSHVEVSAGATPVRHAQSAQKAHCRVSECHGLSPRYNADSHFDFVGANCASPGVDHEQARGHGHTRVGPVYFIRRHRSKSAHGSPMSRAQAANSPTRRLCYDRDEESVVDTRDAVEAYNSEDDIYEHDLDDMGDTTPVPSCKSVPPSFNFHGEDLAKAEEELVSEAESEGEDETTLGTPCFSIAEEAEEEA